MRPGQNKRMRGRPNNNGGGGGSRKGPNPLTRSYESNGPDVKIRGNAHHVAEKYLQLARDAQSSGDPVAAESYLQHAEHYFRLIASAQAAQAGYARQPDAVDTEGEDEDDSGIPDRFASPQPPAPLVPQPVAAQPYQAERQPYNGESRTPYNGQGGQGGERQPYNDRQGGDRPPYNDRGNYPRQDRQDRNGMNRRPYRDANGGEIRADDRQPVPSGQPGQDRPFQERPFQDRQSRRERFAQERLERQERSANGQDRNGQDRPNGERYDRPRDGERLRDGQIGDQPSDGATGEQPRFEAASERQPEVQYQPQPAPAYEAQPEAMPQPSEPPRRRERAERAAPAPVDDAPGLPSFITTPTRVAPAADAAPEPGLATVTAFPGDDADGQPKFPRRRRRTTRAAAEGEAPAAGSEQPASDD